MEYMASRACLKLLNSLTVAFLSNTGHIYIYIYIYIYISYEATSAIAKSIQTA